MKKFFALMAILALVLVGCDLFNPENPEKDNTGSPDINNKTGNNANITGTWTGNYSGSVITLDIAQSTWVMTIRGEGGLDYDNGTWFQAGNTYRFSSSTMNGTGSLSGETLVLRADYSDGFESASITITFKRGSSSGEPSPGNPSTTGTTLKIQNESFSEITDVRWSNVTFTQGTESILNGKFVTKTVQEGDGYIYFKRKTNPINARTDERYTIDKNEQKVVLINDNTIIVDVDNPNNKGTFGTLGVNREPQITLKAGAASITHFGDYDFGSVLLNTNKDVTFTIGNSGKADLKFNVVEGNVINLSNNASGYFSVNQQPFATMTIAPGSTTTFIICFSPKLKGSNFNAEVTIATNSENNAEFTFRVKGDGSNEYKIGDTGPGGGMIFYAQGGQYKECSGELGTYNWPDADNQAKSHKGGGFSNWRLPDIGELDLMYQNLHRKSLGGFSNTYYWSSTEGGYGHLYMNFNTGVQNGYDGESYNIYRVRAVRAFSL